MVDDTQNPLKELFRVQREQTERAKFWWNISRGCQLIVLIVSFLAVDGSVSPAIPAFLGAIFTLGWVGTEWRSDHLKGISQSLLRKYEFWDALGSEWKVADQELSDIYVDIPDPVREKLAGQEVSGDYFASTSEQSSRRLIENLAESCWWSKHVAKRAWQWSALFAVVVFAIGVVVLLTALETAPSQDTADVIARVIVSIYVFVFSDGYVRLTYDYYLFSQAARRSDDKACLMLKDESLEPVRAISLYHEYQIARSASPMLPTWVYNSIKDRLNKEWQRHRGE